MVHAILVREQHFTGLSPLEWITKLLAAVPILIQQHYFKRVRYYLEVAVHVLKSNLIANKFSESDLVQSERVQMQIANTLIEYALALFQFSKGINFNTGRKICIPGGSRFSELNSDEETHGCFRFETIKLKNIKPELLSHVKNFAEAIDIFEHCLPMIKALLEKCDILADPMNFISLHYKLSEMYANIAMFAETAQDRFNYLKARVNDFNQMIDALNSVCPRVISVLQKDLFVDLIDVQIDLMESSFNQALALTDTEENADGDNENVQELVKLLTNIRCFNKRLN
jgi:hypothetical protein